MTSLYIHNCQKLKWLPERMQELFHLLIDCICGTVQVTESFPEGGLLFSLNSFDMELHKLVNGRKEWRLQRLPRLYELSITHDGSDEEILSDDNWELPSSIHSLLEQGLPSPPLSKLCLSDHHELHSLPTESLQHLTSLDHTSPPAVNSNLLQNQHCPPPSLS
ncbi:hypothetical protein HAX54_043239 [Datura stramonium]|uniref:Uncharacterized protein n=1 Tax=Datura stramonium TaxID=4076 RepID=A0ABS8SMW3_DATST|nr:hypothetical protein [Datura stramonium]